VTKLPKRMPKAVPFFSVGDMDKFRVGVMAACFFLLIAANNLIKILRDSIFLGHHSVAELPYLYILVAVLAGAIIATYTRHTANISIIGLILATNAVIVLSIVFFSVLFTYSDPGWGHYVFYIWSAMATVIAVAQMWTLANHLFTPDEGKRSFGLIAAGGTVGGLLASFGVKWSIHLSEDSNHLLWVTAGVYVAVSLLILWAERRFRVRFPDGDIWKTERSEIAATNDIGELLSRSAYLRTIAVIILVSVIVSTLIDFHFKIGAKQMFPSTRDLAGFFSLYYGWLNVATLLAQVLLTGRTLRRLGLARSLNLTPATLLTGAMAIILWPGLVPAMLTRMADITLRNSIHRSGMEIIYMAVPADVVKAVKTFLDVVVERVGDASAGFVILLFSLFAVERYVAYVHFLCLGLILIWLVLNRYLQSRYGEPLRGGTLFNEGPRQRSWLESE
jgi:AAA family ATP:ADP antiporter